MLGLQVLHLPSDEIHVLGDLPSPVYVMIIVTDVSQDKVVVGTGLFPVLEHFWFGSVKDANAYLSFEARAMPKLQRLSLQFSWREWRGATWENIWCTGACGATDAPNSHCAFKTFKKFCKKISTLTQHQCRLSQNFKSKFET